MELMAKPIEITLEELVRTLQDLTRSDDEAVAVLAHMLRTGRVVRQGAVLQ
jgi:hypothetical protein